MWISETDRLDFSTWQPVTASDCYAYVIRQKWLMACHILSYSWYIIIVDRNEVSIRYNHRHRRKSYCHQNRTSGLDRAGNRGRHRQDTQNALYSPIWTCLSRRHTSKSWPEATTVCTLFHSDRYSVIPLFNEKCVPDLCNEWTMHYHNNT